MAWELQLNPTILEDLYLWIDQIPLSKAKRKIERDFSDGVLAAEVIRYYLPDMVTMRNYVPNSSIGQKKINWTTLNKKVLSELGMNLPDNIIKDLSYAKSGTIEIFLFNLRFKIDEIIESRQKIQSHDASPSHQSSISLTNPPGTEEVKTLPSKRTSRSIVNLRDKWVPRLDYEDLKQQSLQLQEEVDILKARLRRLEHVVQLKELRIAELSSTIEDYRHLNPTRQSLSINKYKKK